MAATEVKPFKACTLEHALHYDGETIAHKFMESYDVSFEEAIELFEETKKWLWFATQHQDKRPFIDTSMMMIDNMWHTFILFTKEYSTYCFDKFGRFVHHAPTTKTEKDSLKEKLKKDRKKTIEEAYQKSKQQYEDIYDTLGPDTLIKWYEVYAKKYSPKQINELAKEV